jgi:hypothetical protein
MKILDRFTLWLFKSAIQRNRRFRVAAHKAMIEYFRTEYNEDTVPTRLYIANAELFEAAKFDEELKISMDSYPEMYGLGLSKELNDALNNEAIPVE